MSSPFRGYMFKATVTGETFPNKFIVFRTWKSTPNQREELKAYRDDNSRDLTRVTADGEKSVFSFKVRPGLHLADKIELQSFFRRAEEGVIGRKQRKIRLEFWNDELNDYDTGDFYIPNTDFPIIRITDDDIIYDELELKFIEY